MHLKKLIGVFSVCVFAVPALAQVKPSHTPRPTDAQIAAIVRAANTEEVNEGKLALSKTKNKSVKDFANQMVQDHGTSNREWDDLVQKLNLTPEENDMSRDLASRGAQDVKRLKGLKGEAFDKAYVDEQVSDHQNVLTTIDKTLVPAAKNKDLKAQLVKTRPVVANHLNHAKSLQASLGGGAMCDHAGKKMNECSMDEGNASGQGMMMKKKKH